MDAFELAKEHYFRLKEIYGKGITNIDEYTKVTKEYINLTHKTYDGDYTNMVWELNGEEYTMYNSFSDKHNYVMFVEDCSMAIYRLHGGEGYNTYTLVDEFNSNK